MLALEKSRVHIETAEGAILHYEVLCSNANWLCIKYNVHNILND